MQNDVKDYIQGDYEKIRLLLESLNCNRIWSNGKEIRSTTPDGNNNTSVSINIETLFASIYSQNFYGDIINLVMHFQSVEWKEAMRYCRELFGLKATYKKTSATIDLLADFKGFRMNKQSDFKIENIKVYDDSKLWEYAEGLHPLWFQEGITPSVASRYNIHYDRKGKRIIIPHYSFHDKNALVGIQARTVVSDFEREMFGIPKFLNYIPKYVKNWNLFGFSHNINHINEKKMVVIFESEKSVLQLSSWGMHFGVATGSHLLTKERVEILLKYTADDVEICVAWDSDVPEDEVLQACYKLFMYRKVSYIHSVHETMLNDKPYVNILGEKESPVDRGYDIFNFLLDYRKVVDIDDRLREDDY